MNEGKVRIIDGKLVFEPLNKEDDDQASDLNMKNVYMLDYGLSGPFVMFDEEAQTCKFVFMCQPTGANYSDGRYFAFIVSFENFIQITQDEFRQSRERFDESKIGKVRIV